MSAEMASLTTTYLSSTSNPFDAEIHLTTREAFSGVFGSISLACWIFLLVPQLVENYRNSSAEAISLAFIFVWFLGDVANLAGAFWAGLVPVIVAIAVYFCIADGVLIGQCMYYGLRNRKREGKPFMRGQSLVESESAVVGAVEEEGEEEPLLKRNRTNSMTIPGSIDRRGSSGSQRRRRSSNSRQNDHLAKILEESDEPGTKLWFRNAMRVIAIGVIGTAAWALAYESGAWRPSPTSSGDEPQDMPTGALVLGYFSALAYLGARIPQIMKNARDKSCEGMYMNFSGCTGLVIVLTCFDWQACPSSSSSCLCWEI